MADQLLQAGDFIPMSRQGVMVDVRAPLEYKRGHIPGAVNIPLFTDEQRAVVGTEFARNGQQAAILRGLEQIGPELSERARLLLRYARPDNPVYVYCWRGGMRSAAMSWLFELMGYRVVRLAGGYKSYRRMIHDFFGIPFNLKVVAGPTGSGKTEVLEVLKQMNQQVLDLEQLANHRGSAFGGIGMPDQPGTEQFENLLFEVLHSFDPGRPVWVEDESISVGNCFIPEHLFRQMQLAPAFVVQVPDECRIERLVKMYGAMSPELLEAALTKIEKRLGGEKLRMAVDALHECRFEVVAGIALDYYDKAYRNGLGMRDQRKIVRVKSSSCTPEAIARELLSQV